MSQRINITLDDAYADKLSALADASYLERGTLARSILCSTLDTAVVSAATITEVLDAIPSATIRAYQAFGVAGGVSYQGHGPDRVDGMCGDRHELSRLGGVAILRPGPADRLVEAFVVVDALVGRGRAGGSQSRRPRRRRTRSASIGRQRGSPANR